MGSFSQLSNRRSLTKDLANGTLFGNLFKKSQENVGVNQSPIASVVYQYIVIEVINDPSYFTEGSLDEILATINSFVVKTGVDIPNPNLLQLLPRNTIVAQRINDELAPLDRDRIILLPFFSHLSLPCKPGEHVWGFHPTNTGMSWGYWMCKIVPFSYVDDVNHTHYPRSSSGILSMKNSTGARSQSEADSRDVLPDFRIGPVYANSDGDLSTSPDGRFVDTYDDEFYEKLLKNTNASQMMTYESIPRFKKRPGDLVLEGSNNTLIALGTDRTGGCSEVEVDPSTKIKKIKKTNDIIDGAGSIDIVAGRGQTEKTGGTSVDSKSLADGRKFLSELDKTQTKPNEGDPDWKTDVSRLLVAQKTKVDFNLGIEKFNGDLGLSDSDKGDGAIVIKSDKIRLVARKDVELLVEGPNGPAAIVINTNGDIIFKPSGSGVVKLGGEDANLAILCSDSIQAVPGNISGRPISNGAGGVNGKGGPTGQFAAKVLIK